MRIVRVAVVTGVIGLGLGIGITGCSATPQLAVAGGIHFCLEDPTGGPVGLAIDTRNTGTTSLKIDSITAGGANIVPGKAWLIPAAGKSANSIASLVAPFSADPDWTDRQVVSRGTLKPGQSIAAVATAKMPFGGVSAASIHGVDIDYTTADGSHHTVHSSVTAVFKTHC
jgi:hypothetical protein